MMARNLDHKLAIFSEMVRSLATKGHLSEVTKVEMRAAYEEVRRARLSPAQRFAEDKAATLKAFELASPSMATPTINQRSAGRQDGSGLSGRTPTKKPGESNADYYRRLKAHMEQLGQRADQSARALDVSTDPVLGGAEREAVYQQKRKALLAEGRYAERPRRAAVQATDLDHKAKSLMRAKGQSLNPKSADFRENYIAAIKELA